MTNRNSISIISNNQTMSSLEIAKLTGKRHDHVMRDITNTLGELNINAPHFWGTYKTKQGNEYGCYNLPKRETLILISGYNIVLRAKIIDRWEELERKELEKKNHDAVRAESKLEYKPMTDAISAAHEEIKPYHFSNEADLINRIVLGCAASKYKKQNDIDPSESLRDYLTVKQLDCIVGMQRANTVYIEDGLDFQDRKTKLADLFNRKYKQKLIDEIHLLNA